MTEEEKDLVLKDIFSRVPYNLYVSEYFRETDIWSTPRTIEYVGFYYSLKFPERIKPYLRPLSSMTEEEKYQFREFIEWTYDCNWEDNTLEGMLNGNGIDSHYAIFELFDWLNKKMFDYRGLIEKGLAIKVTEENNPYKD